MSKLKDFYATGGGGYVGQVTPFIGGYFTAAGNVGFTSVLGNDVSSVNTLLNPDGYYVCNGVECNVTGSPIFDGAGRHLPDLTDSRFIMGSTVDGWIGGDNYMSHTHTTSSASLSIAQLAVHNHDMDQRWNETPYGWIGAAGGNRRAYARYTYNTGSGSSHNHGSTGGASVTENRPKFLAAIYVMKVI